MEQHNFYTFEEQTSGKQTPTKEELLQGIEETYQEVYEKTNELLDLLEAYLEPITYRYIQQQNIVRLQVIVDTLKAAKTETQLQSAYVKNL